MDIPVTTQNAFVRLNALRLCSNFAKVHLLLQFTLVSRFFDGFDNFFANSKLSYEISCFQAGKKPKVNDKIPVREKIV